MPRSIYFLAGEASGDAHGAALMRALHSLGEDLRLIGRGGPRMKGIAGDGFQDWSAHSAVMGLVEVLRHYGYFRREFAAAIREIERERPDAVVLIDYPGFNLRLARELRQRLPQLKIIYYISPQVWAWNRRRIPQMARFLDLMLCIFPFEAELYNQSGLRTIFVGHPMVESLGAKRANVVREPNLIGLFPGSRLREVRKLWPIMSRLVEIIRRARPDAVFEVAAASDALRHEMQSLEGVRVVTGGASDIMQRAQVGVVASGTATLEAAFFGLPFVLVYRMAWPTYLAARLLVKVKHAGMPNVLAGREIVPEFIQHQARPERIAATVLRLLNDASYRSEMQANFESVIATLGRGGASDVAARAILQEIP